MPNDSADVPKKPLESGANEIKGMNTSETATLRREWTKFQPSSSVKPAIAKVLGLKPTQLRPERWSGDGKPYRPRPEVKESRFRKHTAAYDRASPAIPSLARRAIALLAESLVHKAAQILEFHEACHRGRHALNMAEP